jgi:NADH dehydrogenase FAD-containing subunit
MADNVAADMSERARAILLDKLIKGGVEIIRKARVTKILNTEVRYERAGLMQKIKNFGHAVLALGTVSEQTLFKDLEKGGVRVFPIGDCISPRKALEAIREGFDLALEI